LSDQSQLFLDREQLCTNALQALVECIFEKSDVPIKPNGIFVGAEERKTAYLETCKMLVRLEASVEALRRAIAELIAFAGSSEVLYARCDAWRRLYEDTVTAFLSHIEKAADFEQEGMHAEPSLIQSACADFCRAAEAEYAELVK